MKVGYATSNECVAAGSRAFKSECEYGFWKCYARVHVSNARYCWFQFVSCKTSFIDFFVCTHKYVDASQHAGHIIIFSFTWKKYFLNKITLRLKKSICLFWFWFYILRFTCFIMVSISGPKHHSEKQNDSISLIGFPCWLKETKQMEMFPPLNIFFFLLIFFLNKKRCFNVSYQLKPPLIQFGWQVSDLRS